MSGPLAVADSILRGRPVARPGASYPRELLRLASCVLLCGAIYGAVMGSFGGWSGDRALQAVASAAKVPFLLLATLLLSLPSFFVLNTLLGVRGDFGEALRAILSSQAVLTIVLVAFAPLTALWYASSTDYKPAILFNALMFGAASLAAQVRLRSAYQPLIARNPAHRVLLRGWLFVFALVGIQMGWLLRPFVGDPNQPFQLFRDNAWGNAYVIVARMIYQVIEGSD